MLLKQSLQLSILLSEKPYHSITVWVVSPNSTLRNDFFLTSVNILPGLIKACLILAFQKFGPLKVQQFRLGQFQNVYQIVQGVVNSFEESNLHVALGMHFLYLWNKDQFFLHYNLLKLIGDFFQFSWFILELQFFLFGYLFTIL